MKVELRIRDTFEAAHQLTSDAAPYECKRLHGHRYQVEIACAGEIDPQTGMLVSYEDMQHELREVLKQIDHTQLETSAPEMGETTTENLVRWLWMKLHKRMGHRAADVKPHLAEVRVQETENTCCVYRGIDD